MTREKQRATHQALRHIFTGSLVLLVSFAGGLHSFTRTSDGLWCCSSTEFARISPALPSLELHTAPAASNLTIYGGWGPGAGAVPLTVQFTAWASGGTPPYSYGWDFGDNTTEASNSSGNVTHTYTVVGTFNATLTVTDSANGSTNETATVIVEATPLAFSSIDASPSPTLDLGQTVRLNTTISGAGGYYNISWLSLPSGCVSQNSTLVTCRPNATGNWPVSVCARDPEYVSGCSPWLGVVVSNGPQLSKITYLPSALDANQSLRLSLVVVGWGYGTQVYKWSGLPPGCVSSDNTTILCTPTDPGTYDIRAVATDSNNGTSTVGATVLVHPDPMVVGIRASPPRIDVGSSLLLTANVTGGLGNYSYDWSGLPAGCHGANDSQLYCAPTSPCTCEVSLTATDPSGFVAIGVTTLAIEIGGTFDVRTGASSTAVVIGSTIWLNTSVSGGVPPFEFSYPALPPGCISANSSSLRCTPDVTGTFEVGVEAQDSAGARQFSSTNVTVAPTPTSALGPSWASATGYIALGFAAAIAIGVAAFAVHRRRRPPN